jgi:molecular chaperone DnaK
MAAGNTTLGRFTLDGIPPAPRGMPQIEVTFDIDANGIVNVSAKDKGTGKEQHITITSSTNMDKSDIDKAVKEAEKFAEEDKKMKEKAEIKNTAEHMLFQSEKTLNDLGEKITEEEKQPVRESIEKLRAVVGSEDIEAIKAATDELQKKFYEISAKIYQQDHQNPDDQANYQENNDNNEDGDYVNTEFKDEE